MSRRRKLFVLLFIIFVMAAIPSFAFAEDVIADDIEQEETDPTVFSVALSNDSFYYSGVERRPIVTVTASKDGQGTVLKKGYDFTVEYRNNKYPGTAKVIIKGLGEYEESLNITKNFKISMRRVTGLKLKERYAKRQKLTWTRSSAVSGYRIYQIKSGVWTCIAEVKGSSHNYYTVRNLKPATSYSFAVKSYVLNGDKKYLSKLSARLATCTKPEPTRITDVKGLVCALKVTWERRKCSGYEVWASKYSDFRTISRKKTVSSKYNYAHLYDLRKCQKYYVKVRPYYVRNGKKVYGNWSYYKTATTKPISAGWNTIKGYKYYYRYGYALTGSNWINGKPYYFDSTGKLRGASYKMWMRAKNASSATNWLIVTDTEVNSTGIYYWTGGEWKLRKYYRCSTGAYDTPTPKGSYYIHSKGYYFSDEDYTCWYWSAFLGSEYLYHSVPYVTDSQKYFRDSRLGLNISHGCVRLDIDHAKWIYDNIPYYTRVVIC